MNNYIAIETHSFVDVITNSSAEIFVCDTDKTLEVVKEIVTVMLQKEYSITYETVFDKPFLYTENIRKDCGKFSYLDQDHIGKIILARKEFTDSPETSQLEKSLNKTFNAKYEWV